MKINGFFSTFSISSKALSAEKRRLAVTAENIANANTTRTNKGTPYQKKVVVQEMVNENNHFLTELKNAGVRLNTTRSEHFKNPNYHPTGVEPGALSDIKTSVIEKDALKAVHDPEHPDANEDGIVYYPDINVVTEMLELISASRSYEANITVMNASKNLARKSMEI